MKPRPIHPAIPRLARLREWCAAHARPLAVGSVMALAAFLALLFYSATWRTGDDGRYYTLGMSIAAGQGLTQYANPLQPPEVLTPPLYPALIAAVIRATDHPVVWVKRAGNLLYVLAAGLAVLALMGPQGVSRAGWMGACMGMFAVGLVSFASFIMSDILFILLVFAVLWLAQMEQGGAGRAAAVGCLCGLAYLTRAAGLALVAAVLFDGLIHRRWKQLAWAGAGLVLVTAPYLYWKAFVVQAPDPNLANALQNAGLPPGSGRWLGFAVYAVREFIRDLPTNLLSIIPSHFLYAAHKVIGSPGLWRMITLLLGAGSAAGFLLRIRRWNAVDFFFLFTMLLIAVLPGTAHPVKYYFFPVLPMAAFYFFSFMDWMAGQLKVRLKWRRTGHFVWAAAAGLFCFSLLLDFAAGTVHFIKENPRRAYGPWAPERFEAFQNDYDDAWARVSEAAAWIEANTPPDALLMSRKPAHLLVMSGRQGWRYEIPAQVGSDSIMAAVEKFAEDRMVLLLEDAFPSGAHAYTYGNNREAVLNQTVRQAPEKWDLLHATGEPETRVWAFAGP